MMDDKTLQKKLDQLARLAQQIQEEAESRYPQGMLFYEAEGSFLVMAGDADGGATERQDFIRFASRPFCNMNCGAW